MSITITGVSKSFGKFEALKSVDLEIRDGELVAILGPSGSGKTTLLRIIAGLEAPTSGTILFQGSDVTRKSARDRGIGFVFQHYALFRHMSVMENVAFGLRVKPRRTRPSNAVIEERVLELLRMVQLEGLAHRYPSQLSGGQRQRVALARALAVQPQLLLLDEPFGALDAKVRQDLRRWLRRLHDELGITSVFVTHDQDEALEVADRVIVMNHGRIEQVGSPDEVYDRPVSPFVYEFLGSVNLFHGRAEDGSLRVRNSPGEPNGAEPVVSYARPHELDISRHRNGATIAAVVRQISMVGPIVRVELQAAEGEYLKAELTRENARELGLQVGEEVHVRPQKLQTFEEDYSI
jgi:sulfate transport system ATP-binding protein